MRRVLVTGGNKGIGLAIVTAILEQQGDTHVILGSRSAARGEAAVQGLVAAHPEFSDRLEMLEIDVSRDDSVTDAAAQLSARLGSERDALYGIVNNAGIGAGDLEDILQVNVLGIHRVCEAFMPLLDPSSGRIVNITSAAGPNFVADCSSDMQQLFLDAEMTWPRLTSFMDTCLAITGGPEEFAAKGLGGGASYGLSKACANSYTLLLARENPQLRINACTPGFIETDMTRPFADAQGKAPSEMGMKPPTEGAKAAVFLLFGEPEGSGHYYGSDAKRSPLDRYRAPGAPAYTGD